MGDNRMITSSEQICGEDTLDMPLDIMDASSPLHNKIPTPPVLGAQGDYIVGQSIQLPLRRMVLEQLQRLILANKSSSWFCIYLCTFILLHNFSKVTQNDRAYAVKHGLNVGTKFPATIQAFCACY